MAKRWGLPLVGVRARLVHGCMYVRPQGVGEGDKPAPTPPKFVMKLVARLHPEMRRRNRSAAQAWAQKLWRTEVDHWFDVERSEVIARNLALQAVDLATLDNHELDLHIADTLSHFGEQLRFNMSEHGGDMMPTGDLLAHCAHWGIDATIAMTLLDGSSPATIETATMLAPLAQALEALAVQPTSVEEMRAMGSEVRDAIDAWHSMHAWRLVTGDDVDSATMAEMPVVQFAALLVSSRPATTHAHAAATSHVRAQVPAADRPLFDELVGEARYGHRQRDDVRGIRCNWPAGLIRRGLLEAGRRLVAAGALHEVSHVFELTPQEMNACLRGGRGPIADESGRRADFRNEIERLSPPRMLGDPEAPPMLDALPTAMARATEAMMMNLQFDATVRQTRPLHGVGIGDATYRGRALVVNNDADAFDRIEAGDVLVAVCTGPSINAILPLAGALVVEEGGPVCHAAIVAREFGIPALVGTLNATTAIPDGAEVEVDPVAGVVRVLDTR